MFKAIEEDEETSDTEECIKDKGSKESSQSEQDKSEAREDFAEGE